MLPHIEQQIASQLSAIMLDHVPGPLSVYRQLTTTTKNDSIGHADYRNSSHVNGDNANENAHVYRSKHKLQRALLYSRQLR